MHVRLIAHLKLSLGLNVNVHDYLSLCGPVMDWRPVQGATSVLPLAQWQHGEAPVPLHSGIGRGYRKWMCVYVCALCKFQVLRVEKEMRKIFADF